VIYSVDSVSRISLSGLMLNLIDMFCRQWTDSSNWLVFLYFDYWHQCIVDMQLPIVKMSSPLNLFSVGL